MIGYEMEHFSSSYEATPLDIHINCSNRDVRGELELEWVYRLEYFSEEMIRQIHYYLSNILADALDDPGRRVCEIDFLPGSIALSAGPRAEAFDKSFAGVKVPAARAPSEKSPLDEKPPLDDVFMSDWERIIADAWKEVLQLEAVGVDDNFFDIGGTSLNIIQVNIKLKELLKRDVAMLALYEFPTIAGLAKYLAGEAGAGGFPKPAAVENLSLQSKETLMETVEVFAGLEE